MYNLFGFVNFDPIFKIICDSFLKSSLDQWIEFFSNLQLRYLKALVWFVTLIPFFQGHRRILQTYVLNQWMDFT